MGRLKYLCYRCYACNRLLTALEIESKWEKWEAEGGQEHTGLCVCGSGRISPTNPKWYEEFYPRVLKLWLKRVLPAQLKKAFGR